jgi:hypothetical protein
LTTGAVKAAVMTMPMKSSMLLSSGLSARFRDDGALARWVKRKCLAQAGLEQPGRQQPAQPAQKSCLADRPSHAVGPFSIDRNTSSAMSFGFGAVLVSWVITAAVGWRCAP